MPLTDLPNIGPILAEKLILAGITTPDLLKETGTETIFIRLKKADPSSCLSSLYAIEGAVQNKRWHHLSKERKNELKLFFDSLND